MEIKIIETGHISARSPYSYHYDRYSDELMESIQKNGILMPVWIMNNGKLLVIDGHRRLMVAKDLGFKNVPAILHTSEKLAQVFLSGIYLNLANSNLSTIEKLKILNISQAIDRNSLYRTVLKIFGFSFISDIKNITSRLLKLPVYFQNYLHSKNISLSHLERILDYPYDEYLSWLKLGIDMPFNFSDFLQNLAKINEICRRDSHTPREIWKILGISAILESNSTPQQKVKKIKKLVDAHRFPTLTRINTDLDKITKSIESETDGRLILSWDKTLEKSDLIFKYYLKDTNDILYLESFLANNRSRERLAEVLKKLNQLS